MPAVVSVSILAVVVAAVGITVAFRLGRLRGMARWYFDDGAPVVVRNLAFVTVPVAIYGLLTLGVVAASLSGEPWPTPVVYGGVAVGVVALFAGVWVAGSPPDLLKPPWLRRAERRRRPTTVADRVSGDLERFAGFDQRVRDAASWPWRVLRRVLRWAREVVARAGRALRRALSSRSDSRGD